MARQAGTTEVKMELADIPGTSLKVSPVALGTWAIGGWMWGGSDEAESISTIRTALEHGVNVIDTAPVYGFGRSEEIVGKALAMDGRRKRALIATKAGLNWKDNKPYPLKSWSADELAKLPTYYVMDLASNMAETVAKEMPSAQAIAATQWLPDGELSFYSGEYARTGFQGGLQWYRCGTSGEFVAELQTWSGRSIDVPSCFISGKQDWGTYQRPGVFETMQTRACSRMVGCHLVDGAGHWVQQEQPAEVSRLLLQFLKDAQR